jgi:quercetin dioxygenase-like cupin family protein
MKKIYLTLICILALASINLLNAQDAPLFPKGELSKADNHTGDIWLSELSTPDSVFNSSIAFATYGTNAKLDWHIHPAGQVLLVTEGTGYYQERGSAVRIITKGDVVKCLPGVQHWHGATPNTTFAYVAMTPAQKGKTIWKERLAESEYKKLATIPAPINQTEVYIKELSQKKWDWMSSKNTDSLAVLFNDKCEFVHMGGTWGKEREVDIIKGGFIWYKKAEVYSRSVKFYGNTAIVLSDIDLVAVVGGNDAINPFMVTEVYVNEGGVWKLGQLTFSHLARPLKLPK